MISDIVIIVLCFIRFFFFKQKTAYDMRISDWSSDVCSSDLISLKVNYKDLKFYQFTCHLFEISEIRSMKTRYLSYSFITKASLRDDKIGRASCRERVCQYV